jgi:hypothetical protein
MANPFNDLPLRENADDVDSSWWNSIRAALVMVFPWIFGEEQFTLLDNQSSYVDITGFIFDGTILAAVTVEYTFYRTDGAEERRETGYITAHYFPIGATWSFSRRTDHGTDALDPLGAITDAFRVNTAGQLQYKSDSMGGTYLGWARVKVTKTFLKAV